MTDYLPILSYIFITSCMAAGHFLLNRQSRIAVYIFGITELTTGFIGHYIPAYLGTFYYILSGLADLLIITILSQIAKPTKLIITIQEVCGVFILLNFAGWVMFMLYFSPAFYNFLCTLLYIGLFFLILTGGDKNVIGNNTMDRRHTSILGDHFARDYVVQTDKKTARD